MNNMIIPEITSRVKRLREIYMDCPMMKHKLSYQMDRRQRLLFRRGWLLHPELTDNLLRRSYANAYVLEHMKPIIYTDELIAGQPDFTELTDDENEEMSQLCNIPGDPGRESHMALDFEKLLKLGVDGLIAEIKSNDNWQENSFYNGAVRELEALLTLAEHYSEYARSIGCSELADLLTRVPKNPASSLREALQSVHFYSFNLWGLYQAGRPDQYLLPFYEADTSSGKETVQSAQELIDCFCLLYSTYIVSNSSIGFMVGGRNSDGNPVENQLTWLFLNSIGHTRTADPSIGLCVTDETSIELLNFAAKQIADGCTHPAFYNDNAITAALLEYGLAPSDTHDYIHSCCVEITVAGKSAIWTVSPYHNTLKLLLDVMREREFTSYGELFDCYTEHLAETIKAGNDNENRWQELRWQNGHEPLRVSCLVDECIKRGKSIDRGGAVYNQIQPNFLGIFNTVDSLWAIKQLVFTDKRLTLAEFVRILDNNYEGSDELRAYINNKLPHYGNDDDRCDSIARQLTDAICKCCEQLRTFRGDIVVPAAFSYNEHIRHGKNTPASPDGRLSGEPLNDGTNPVQGHDVSGPLAMLHSGAAWKQSKFMGGIATNLELTHTQANPELIISLMKAYFEGGGIELQINVVNSEELADAKLHPEKHRNLVVRIGGYSDYFTSLPEALQDEVISRTRT